MGHFWKEPKYSFVSSLFLASGLVWYQYTFIGAQQATYAADPCSSMWGVNQC